MKSVPWKEEAPGDATQSIYAWIFSLSFNAKSSKREQLEVLKETQTWAVFSWSLRGKCWDRAGWTSMTRYFVTKYDICSEPHIFWSNIFGEWDCHPLICIFAGKPQLWCGRSDIKWTNMYIHFWAANLPLQGSFLICLSATWVSLKEEQGTEVLPVVLVGFRGGIRSLLRREAELGFLLGEAPPFQGCGEQEQARAAGRVRHTELAGFPVFSSIYRLQCLRGEWWDTLSLLMEQLEAWHSQSEQKPLGSCGEHSVVTGSVIKVGVRVEEKTALSRQISRKAAFLAGLPECLFLSCFPWWNQKNSIV